jgi:virginiamycin B lyase
MWFVAQSPSIVGRIDGSGTIQTTALASGTANPTNIVSGPDGALWFTEGVTKAIGRIPPVTPLGVPDESRTTADAPGAIATGGDGNLWFTEYSAQMIGRMTPAGMAMYIPTSPSTGNPVDITAAPDGSLWYIELNPTDVVRLATDGTQTPTKLPKGVAPFALTFGPDHALWFAAGDSIVRMTTDGTFQTFPLRSGTGATSITTGPDGNVWFNEENVGNIGRITTPPIATTTAAAATGPTSATITGTVNGHAQATSFRFEYGPIGGAMIRTPEHGLGVTTGDTAVSALVGGLAPGMRYQARVVAINPTGTTAGSFLSFTTAPAAVLSNLQVLPRTLSLVGRTVKGHCVKPTKNNKADTCCPRQIRLRVSYMLNVVSTVTLALKRKVSGREVNGRCAKPTNKNRTHSKCTRLLNLRGKITLVGKSGPNRFTFNGKIGGHAIGPGTYQLIATPTGGKQRKATFKVVS